MEATGQLKIVETRTDERSETVILHLTGDIDSNTAPELKARLLSLMGQVRGIILDFGGVEYVSSAGWGVVLARIKEQRSRGGDIVFARMNSEVNSVFELLDLEQVAQHFASIEDGLHYFASTN